MRYLQSIILILSIVFFAGCATKEYQGTEVAKKITEDKKNIKDVKKEVTSSSKQTLQESIIKETPQEPVYETIGMVFPSSDIDRYALEATNTLNTYLLHKKGHYALETFDMLVQNKKNILKSFEQIKAKGIKKVILMITKDYVNYLQYVPDLDTYEIVLPLVNKYEQILEDRLLASNILFGAISYKRQFDKLISYSKGYSLVEFYDNSPIGDTLHNYVKDKNLKYSRMIDDNNGRYKNILRYHKSKIKKAAIILNTPIVKSSILLSASIAEEIYPPLVLSTQLNYTPLIFSLTQVNDRKNLVVASSIGELSPNLKEYNKLLGNNILYNWVNYSSIVAAEYLLEKSIDSFKDLKIEDNQIIYPVKLYDVKYYSFKEIK